MKNVIKDELVKLYQKFYKKVQYFMSAFNIGINNKEILKSL